MSAFRRQIWEMSHQRKSRNSSLWSCKTLPTSTQRLQQFPKCLHLQISTLATTATVRLTSKVLPILPHTAHRNDRSNHSGNGGRLVNRRIWQQWETLKR